MGLRLGCLESRWSNNSACHFIMRMLAETETETPLPPTRRMTRGGGEEERCGKSHENRSWGVAQREETLFYTVPY